MALGGKFPILRRRGGWRKVMARYSTSELDSATISFFWLFHETRLPPTSVQYPVIDLQSVLEPAQSTSYTPPCLRDHDKCTKYPVLALPLKIL